MAHLPHMAHACLASYAATAAAVGEVYLGAEAASAFAYAAHDAVACFCHASHAACDAMLAVLAGAAAATELGRGHAAGCGHVPAMEGRC